LVGGACFSQEVVNTTGLKYGLYDGWAGI